MHTVEEIREKTVSEIRNVSVDMRGKLDTGELLTGIPSVAEIGTSDLVFLNQAVSAIELTINNKKVAAGQAVQFKVTGGVKGTVYEIRITVATTASPPQTLISIVQLRITED